MTDQIPSQRERPLDAAKRPLCYECRLPQSAHPGGIECTAQEDTVTVVLLREDAVRVHELVVAKAVNVEAAEDMTMSGLGSWDFRRPANTLRGAIDGR